MPQHANTFDRHSGDSICANCSVRRFSLCEHLLVGDAGAIAGPQQLHMAAKPGQILYRAGTTLEHLPVLCEGWALRFVSLSGGRRQILSFLLPGDMMSAMSLFTGRNSASIQTITKARYCLFRRGEILRILATKDTAQADGGQFIAEQQEICEQQLTDLGRRSAQERIARLILGLARRLRHRGLQWQGEFPFPLTQQHIADAMGLTQIHVSRILKVFRKAGIMKLSHGILAMYDTLALHHIADMEPADDD